MLEATLEGGIRYLSNYREMEIREKQNNSSNYRGAKGQESREI